MSGLEDDRGPGVIRTVLGDIGAETDGVIYAHEHLIIDSPMVQDRFPHIHLPDVATGVRETESCGNAGVRLMVDAMPCSAGRNIEKLVSISEQTRVNIVAVTGLHHDRYYGPGHWSNHVSSSELAALFVADLLEGIDVFDYTGPIVNRTPHRAGALKIATSGDHLDERDRRNLDAVAQAFLKTGAPILTHCENGQGALEQVDYLTAAGVPAASIILSHVDKSGDLGYLRRICETGAILEFDQSLRQYQQGSTGWSVRALATLASEGHWKQIVVGTDGARRSLWASLDGAPGLAWLAQNLPALLTQNGVVDEQIHAVMRDNASRALTWHPLAA